MLKNSFDEPLKILQLLSRFPFRWGICGGWALDLFVGRISRPHKDVDVAILRKDQLAFREYLTAGEWEAGVTSHGRLQPWVDGHFLELPMHSVQCKATSVNSANLEVLLNEADETHFRFRRNQTIRLALSSAFVRCERGVPILAPGIVLLYKSKSKSAEDDADFTNCVPYLGDSSREWLKASLRTLDPTHAWLAKL